MFITPVTEPAIIARDIQAQRPRDRHRQLQPRHRERQAGQSRVARYSPAPRAGSRSLRARNRPPRPPLGRGGDRPTARASLSDSQPPTMFISVAAISGKLAADAHFDLREVADFGKVGRQPLQVHPEHPAVAEVHQAEAQQVAAAEDSPPRNRRPAFSDAPASDSSSSASSACVEPRNVPAESRDSRDTRRSPPRIPSAPKR